MGADLFKRKSPHFNYSIRLLAFYIDGLLEQNIFSSFSYELKM